MFDRFPRPLRRFVVVLIMLLSRESDAQALPAPDPRLRAYPLINEGYPRVSPDGSRLLFVSDRDGDYEVFVRDLASGLTTQLTHNAAADYAAQWSPDGRRILYTSNRNGNEDVFEWDLVAGIERNVVRSSADEHDPSYDPRAHGRVIVFARTLARATPTTAERRAILRRELSTGQEMMLTEGWGIESYPSLSPRSGELLFRRTVPGEASAILVRDLSTGVERVISPHRARDDYPAWAFGGTRIVFASDRATDGGGYDLYMTRDDGSDLRRLTSASSTVAFHHRPTFDASRGEVVANRRIRDRLEAVAIAVDTSHRGTPPGTSLRVLTPDR